MKTGQDIQREVRQINHEHNRRNRQIDRQELAVKLVIWLVVVAVVGVFAVRVAMAGDGRRDATPTGKYQTQPEERLAMTIPAQAVGTIRLVNAGAGLSVTIDKAAGQTLDIYWTNGRDDGGGGTGGVDHGHGVYGDSWPTPHGHRTIRPGDDADWDRGRVNGQRLGRVTLAGFDWAGDGSDFGLKLINCDGDIDFVGCTFRDSRQGFMSTWDSAVGDGDLGQLNVRFFGCRFIDNYVDGNTGLPAEVGAYHNARGTRSLIGFYGCIFLNSGYDGTEAGRLTDASIYDHGVYPKGNPDIEVIDCLFVNSSGQAFKGIGSDVLFLRNAVVGSAIGFGIGMDGDQQDKTGRHETTGSVTGNMFYAMGDLPINNQRLGWGLVLQSCDIDVVGNIFTTPDTQNDKRPAIRLNRERDYAVTLRMSDNIVLGYRHVLESFGGGQDWSASVSGAGNTASLGTRLVHDRAGGLVAGTVGMRETGQPLPELDVDDIAARARAGTIRADEVIEMVRGQIDE